MRLYLSSFRLVQRTDRLLDLITGPGRVAIVADATASPTWPCATARRLSSTARRARSCRRTGRTGSRMDR